MISLWQIPDLIANSPTLTKEQKLELLVDIYNDYQRAKPFNFFPKYIKKEEILDKYKNNQ